MTAEELRDHLIGHGVDKLLALDAAKHVAVAAPAAGVDWSQTVPAGVYWELTSVSATFAASAIAANRAVTLNIANADNVRVLRVTSLASLVASSMTVVEWAAGIGVTNSFVTQMASLPSPPLALRPGWTISVNTGAMDAADQWSLIQLFIQEWSPAQVAQRADQFIDRYYDLFANL